MGKTQYVKELERENKKLYKINNKKLTKKAILSRYDISIRKKRKKTTKKRKKSTKKRKKTTKKKK